LSGSSSTRFAGSRNFDFGRRGFDRGGFRRRGFGDNRFGYGHFGYGGFGYGGGWFNDPFADLWFLGDLFGLALDVGRFAIGPAWGFLGADLLGTSLQALSDAGGDSYDNNSYSSYGDNSYADQTDFADGSQFRSAPCGNYYSDENPGCVQQY
jgi:hypothetical protein